MTRKLTHSPLAEKDIDELVDYLALENYDLAIRFIDAVQKTEKILLDMPEIGVLRNYSSKRLMDMRMVLVTDFPNHLIFYIPTPTTIHVVRVLHGAQDIEAVFE